jgi:hypothetical protein
MLLDVVWLPLLIKLAATVVVVIAATLLAERAGPFWAGLMCAFPLSSGPAYVLLALQSDAAFVGESALNTLAGTVATTLFMLALVRLAPRWSIVPVLLAATACWVGAILIARPIPWTLAGAIVANLVVIAACCRVTRGYELGATPRIAGGSWIDLPLRALVIGLVVASVVSASQIIGPTWTGLAISFPITLSSFSIVLHGRQGGRALAATMAMALRALPGFSLALVTLHLVAPVHGSTVGLLSALAASIAYAIGMMLWRTRPAPAAVLH